ncbi:MAG: GyrI-like domain-containing protein [Gammaproteobacteria bacterium]|nr:GyrI-like domain-containing protein [Gammaproteobacteria bacterium]
MESPFEIIEKEIGPVIEVEESVPIWKMPATFGRDFGLISDYIESQGSSIREMPYARYLDIDWEAESKMGFFSQLLRVFSKKWHFQVGMPTASELAGEGDLISRTFGRRRYVKSLHLGPYKDVGKSYDAMILWLKEQGEVAEGESIEIYLNSPQDVKQSELETELLIPLK